MQTAYDIESNPLSIDNLTLITLTHNLGEDLLALYDQIIYMENVCVLEMGSYNELVSHKSHFYRFITLNK